MIKETDKQKILEKIDGRIRELKVTRLEITQQLSEAKELARNLAKQEIDISSTIAGMHIVREDIQKIESNKTGKEEGDYEKNVVLSGQRPACVVHRELQT